jgi:hypothetical protein
VSFENTEKDELFLTEVNREMSTAIEISQIDQEFSVH